MGRVLRWQRNRRRSKPYRVLRQAEQRAAKENVKLAWQTALRDNPELRRKNALAKWIQKQKIKRKYAQAAHEAKQTAHFTQNVVQATGQIVRAVQQYIAARKSLLLVVAMLAMVVVFFASGMTSCTAMLSGFQSSYISASYMANEQDICNSDLYYTEMETDLQMDIDQTEENYPGYDEYHAPVQVLLPADGVDPVAVAAGHIAQPWKVEGVSIRLPVAEGLLIHVVAVRLLTRGQRTGNDRGQRCYRQRGLQDIPIVGVAVAVIAGFHNDLPCKLVLLPEQPRKLRLNLFKGEGVEHGGEIAHQLPGRGHCRGTGHAHPGNP